MGLHLQATIVLLVFLRSRDLNARLVYLALKGKTVRSVCIPLQELIVWNAKRLSRERIVRNACHPTQVPNVSNVHSPLQESIVRNVSVILWALNVMSVLLVSKNRKRIVRSVHPIGRMSVASVRSIGQDPLVMCVLLDLRARSVRSVVTFGKVRIVLFVLLALKKRAIVLRVLSPSVESIVLHVKMVMKESHAIDLPNQTMKSWIPSFMEPC